MIFRLFRDEIPTKIFDKPIMTKKQYRAVADKIGFPLDFEQMIWSHWETESVYIVKNHIYGHRHWITLNNCKEIVGLTIGHSGWMVERRLWEELGLSTELCAPKGLGYLLILGDENGK